MKHIIKDVQINVEGHHVNGPIIFVRHQDISKLMQGQLKLLLDDKAEMKQFCESIHVPMVPTTIYTSIDDIVIDTNQLCVKNSKGCCGVHSCRGDASFVGKWLARQKRRNLPSNKWIVQPDLGPSLDEIRLVYGIFDANDVRHMWSNTNDVEDAHKTAIHVISEAMKVLKDHAVTNPFCVAFDFLSDKTTLLEINVEGHHFNACPCQGRIEYKHRREGGASATTKRGFITTDARGARSDRSEYRAPSSTTL